VPKTICLAANVVLAALALAEPELAGLELELAGLELELAGLELEAEHPAALSRPAVTTVALSRAVPRSLEISIR
jgi:hypothetical protein